MTNKLVELWRQFKVAVETELGLAQRAIKDVESWDGSAANYGSTDEYCSACLIDVNSAAGRDTKAQSHCMLPVRGPGDSAGTFVRQAVHAAAGGHGITQVKKPSDVPQAAWDSAVSAAAKKLVTAYGQMDEEPPESVTNLTRAIQMGTIFQDVCDIAEEKYPMAYVADFYTEDDGTMFVILVDEGKMYRAGIRVENGQVMMDDWQPVAINFTPVQTETMVRQLPDGKYRWISRSATSTLNRVGEIDSRALFQSFVDHIEATGEYPIRQFYHQGEQFRTGQADFVAVDGNVLITSGIYDDTVLAKKECRAIQREPAYWGESIGYYPTDEPEMMDVSGIKIPVYNAGVLREISTLPEKEAANLFTKIHPTEVTRMLKGKAKEAFIKLFEDETDPVMAADTWLNENVEELNRSIADSGLITRETEQAAAEQPAVTQQPAELVLDDAAISAIVARLLEGETAAPVVARAMENEVIVTLRTKVDEMAKVIDDLQSRLALVEVDEAEKKRKWQADLPARVTGKVAVTYRPSQVNSGNGEGKLTASQLAEARRPAGLNY